MRSAATLLLLAYTIGATSVGQAIDFGSIAKWCFANSKTYACGESFSSISASEVSTFYAIDVSAMFSGPGYYETFSKQSVVVGWNPSTWTAKVKLAPMVCAFSGPHSVEGAHWWHVVPGADPMGGVDSSDVHIRPYCDCGGAIP